MKSFYFIIPSSLPLLLLLSAFSTAAHPVPSTIHLGQAKNFSLYPRAQEDNVRTEYDYIHDTSTVSQAQAQPHSADGNASNPGPGARTRTTAATRRLGRSAVTKRSARGGSGSQNLRAHSGQPSGSGRGCSPRGGAHTPPASGSGDPPTPGAQSPRRLTYRMHSPQATVIGRTVYTDESYKKEIDNFVRSCEKAEKSSESWKQSSQAEPAQTKRRLAGLKGTATGWFRDVHNLDALLRHDEARYKVFKAGPMYQRCMVQLTAAVTHMPELDPNWQHRSEGRRSPSPRQATSRPPTAHNERPPTSYDDFWNSMYPITPEQAPSPTFPNCAQQ